MSVQDIGSDTGTAARTAPQKAGRRGARGATLAFWVFVGPFLIGLLIFSYIPIVWGAVISFFEARSTVTPSKFVGLDNYISMLKDGAFTSSLVTFSIYAAFIVPLTFAFSLFLAIMVNQVRVARAFFRSVFFVPTACSYVVASLIWKLAIFNGPKFGLANTILGWFGHAPIAWLVSISPPWYWLPLVTVRLWLQAGFYMLLFLAGLQRIPRDLYEAAYVDGARRGWQVFRYVTLPQLRGTAIAVLLLNLINAYQAFDEFYNLIGNQNYARPPLIYLYSTALGASQDYGRGSAGAFILAILIMIVTLLQAKVFGFGKSAE